MQKEDGEFRRNALQGLLITDLLRLDGQLKYDFNIKIAGIFRGPEDMSFVAEVMQKYFQRENYRDLGGVFGETGGRKTLQRGNNFIYADIYLLKDKLSVSLRQHRFDGRIKIDN